GHANERGVNDGVAVWVVVAAGVAGDLRALDVLAPRGQVQVVHGEQNSPLRRFQAVTDVGQGPVHDGAHRVRQIRVLQLAFDLQIFDAIERRAAGGLRGR